MIKKLRGTLAIAAVIVLIATGPVVTQVWFQAANAQKEKILMPREDTAAYSAHIVGKAKLLSQYFKTGQNGRHKLKILGD